MGKKIEIAVFTGSIVLDKDYYDVRNKYIIERLRYLKDFDNLEISIISPTGISDKFKKFHYITYPFLNKKHLKLISITVFSFFKLLTLNCNKFHIFHCYSHEAAIIALFARIILRKRIRILFEPMGLAAEESRIYARSSIKCRLLKPFVIVQEKLIFNKSYGIIVYTESWKDYMTDFYKISKDRIFVVPHGVNLGLFAQDNKKSQNLIDKLNLQNKKVIMYVGTISELHGPMVLVKAIQIVNKKAKNVAFVIVGEGSLKPKVMKYLKKNQLDNVILKGKIPQQDVPRYYALADILVIPHVSPELDLPTKLFEYLASGKPIISSNLKAIADVVGDSVILVEPDSPQSLAAGILKLLNNGELQKKLGKKGKGLIYDYSWKESVRKQYEAYLSLYDSIKHEYICW